MTDPLNGRLPKLSVVIPAFNEEAGILPILDRVLALRGPLAEAGLAGPEVIVVDDGSQDRTGELVQRFGDVHLIRNVENRGYGAALKAGMAQATGDLIAFLDADGTYPPESFPRLCQAALAGADVVIGSRMAGAINGAQNGMPWTRRVGNRVFAGLVTALGDHRVRDCASGMRVLRREILPKLYPLPDGLNFTPIMTVRAMHEGLNLVEVPIAYAERVGESKLSVARDGLQYTRSIIWTALGYNPVRVFGMLGLAGVVLTLFVGIALVVARLSGVTTLGPWGVAAIFAALVSGVSGVSLFSLGATFNYLVALHRNEAVRAGLFGQPLFDPPLEHHFGWAGAAAVVAGISLALGALVLGLHGWEIARLWLYLVGSALSVLVGLQLMISWVLMRTLDELSEREMHTQRDLAGGSPWKE